VEFGLRDLASDIEADIPKRLASIDERVSCVHRRVLFWQVNANCDIRVTPDGDAEPVADALDAALAAARKRGQDKAANILKGDDMLTARDFGSLIGASHETVNVRRQRGEILGLQGATRVVRYPSWQVTDAGTIVPGLAQLSEVLGGQPWTVYRFLRTAHAELDGRTALDVLKAGRQEDVLKVARNQTSGAFT
jgi:hypothetical protein